ncbi:hypothetical protein [Paenibacillus koleovorans]|uniref:hypothetical protein n=1 Tax=Paenibacillus koleovorans TaxID=121608 RepID=UPI000FDC0E33|nr:hypothetical protein [Paenibacillus koleovorans]
MSNPPQQNESHRLEWNNEEGAALVIALLAVVLMTIMGMVLLEVLRGGAVQAVSTEAGIQAEAIAQKGLDDTLAQIRRAVAAGETNGDALQNSKTRYRNRINEVESQLSSILTAFDDEIGTGSKAGNGKVVRANRGSYRIDILSVETVNPEAANKPITYPDFPYVRKFVIQSVGTIDSHPGRTVTKQMTAYVSTINPVFRYPVSSGGDLKLNGTPYVVGDVIVRGNSLHVRNEAMFVGASGTKFGVQTGLPALRGFIRVNGDGTTADENKKYTLQTDIETTSADVMEPNYFTPLYFPLEDPKLDFDTMVDVGAYVADKLEKSNQRLTGNFGEKHLDEVDYEVTNATKSTSILYTNMWVAYQGRVTVDPGASAGDGDVFVNNGTLTMFDPSSARSDDDPVLSLRRGSLYVRSTDPNLVAGDFRGEISIDEDKFVAVQGNVSLNNGFKFMQGTMYIDGDLKIIGDITLQGTVYVNGNVELKEMRSINKPDAGQTNKIPLIIIASGEIVLGNNTNENNANDQIRAFLYSQQGLKLYGVLSRLKLTGGVHGEDEVELNAVRGELTGGSIVNEYEGRWNGSVPEPQINLPADRSRLQIIYDNALYDQPPAGIPTMNDFNVFAKDIQYK